MSGFALYQCQNGGGNAAPGQNRVLAGPATSDTAIPASAIKNGNLTFTTNPATLTAATTVSGAAAGCPNPNWTGVNPTLTLTTINLAIEHPDLHLRGIQPRRFDQSGHPRLLAPQAPTRARP